MSGVRLNPFALPPATTGRFLLLIATAMAASVQVYGWLVARLPTVSAAPGRCVDTARQVAGTMPPDHLIDWYNRCEVWASVREARFVGLMIAVFVMVTLVIYVAMPWWTRRSLVPLRHPAIGPHLRVSVHTIEEFVASRAGAHVRIYVSMASGRDDRVFGRVGRYAIVLDVHRLVEAAADPSDPALRSVLLHEIAHLRNRDVDLTYLTIAVWWGFLAAVVALPVAYVAWQAPETLWSLSWRLGVLLVLFWLLRASVLRAREHYADVGADADDDLIRTLMVSPGPHDGSRVRGWFRLHPYTKDRVGTIRDTDRLFTLEPGVAAAVGVLTGLGYPPAAYFVTLLLPDRAYLPGWICGLTFGLFVAAVLAGATWRAALWAASAPGRTVRTFPSAVALTAALTGGLLLTPDLPRTGSFRRVAETTPVTALVAGVLLLGLTWVFLRWTLFCAACRLPVAGSPRLSYRFGVLQAAVVLGVWLAAWFRLCGMLLVTGTTGPTVIVAAVSALADPLLLISLPWVFWYPLATWQTRRAVDRRRRFPLWRDHDDHRPLHGRRTPLGAAHLAALGILVAYAVVLIPFYPRLRGLLEARMDDLTPSASEHLPVVALLVVPAVVLTGLGMLILGAVTGGRGGLERAGTAAGSSVLLVSAGAVVLMLMHVSLAAPRARTLVELLVGLTVSGEDHAENAALGLMVLALFGLLLLAGLPLAGLGSLIRSIGAPPRRPRPPGRPAWMAAVLITPMLLVGSAVAWLGGAEWHVPDTVTVANSIDIGRVELVLAEPWPIDASLGEACGRMAYGVAGVEFDDGTTSGGFDLLLARAAASARSAADVPLRTMGEGTIDALRRSQLRRAQLGVTAAMRYCATALTMV
jgi:hypothetical protein